MMNKEDVKNIIREYAKDPEYRDVLLSNLKHLKKRREFLKKAPIDAELSRRYFWHYLKTMHPSFFKEENVYQKDMAFILQGVYQNRLMEFIDEGFLDGGNEVVDGVKRGLTLYIDGEEVKYQDIDSEIDWDLIIINIPPRHGKTFIISMFSTWVLGIHVVEQIAIAAYNTELSIDFSKGIRANIPKENDEIEESENDTSLEYHHIFPQTKIKYGSNRDSNWSIVGGRDSFKAISPGSLYTGKGSSMLLVDDMVKNAEEAYNDKVLDGVWSWYVNTAASRMESMEGNKQLKVVIGTRWCKEDLSGKVLDNEIKHNKTVHYSQPALLDKEAKQMLAPNVLSYEDYIKRTANMNPDIVEANYNQKIIGLKGFRMYEKLHIYDVEKVKDIALDIYTYTDVADQGEDYLAHIVAGVDRLTHKIYILDVVYTDKGFDETVPMVASTIFNYGVIAGLVETNNAGFRFLEDLHKFYESEYGGYFPLTGKYQKDNKMARILSQSTYCQNNILYPNDYSERPMMREFMEEIQRFKKKGGNSRDDGVDALTGIAELVQDPQVLGNVYNSEYVGVPIEDVSAAYSYTIDNL